jgi:tripartite-type tricarboxylate transporter receptor subunit TctC
MNTKNILALVVSLTLAFGATAPTAFAQAYPARAIKIIVPYGPGGASDISTRMVAEKLAVQMKQPVVVENKPGGGSIIGVGALKVAPPDGYTIGLLVSANAALPWLRKDMPFDILKDFIPLTSMYTGPLVLTVGTDVPAKTFKEFIEYSKANPGKVFAGSIGAGTTTNLAAELLNQMAGISLTNVSYRSATDVHAAVVGGTVQSAFDNLGTPKPLIESGRERALAVTGKKRIPVLPEVPAIAEFYPGYEIVSWTGFALPLGTPPAIVDRLTVELRKAMQDPAIRTYLQETVGAEPGGGPPEELRQRIANDHAMFGKIIKTAGIKID